MMAGFLLALPATWLCDQLVVRDRVVVKHVGGVMRARGNVSQRGDMIAFIEPLDAAQRSWRGGIPIAELTVASEQMRRGWPLVTTVSAPTTDVDWRIFDPDGAYRDTHAGFKSEAALRAALDASIRTSGASELRAAWRRTDATSQPIIMAWIFGATMWWIMLYLAGLAMIALARLGWFVITRRKRKQAHRLSAENRCIKCGYQLHGLEFNERCPECGSLVY